MQIGRIPLFSRVFAFFINLVYSVYFVPNLYMLHFQSYYSLHCLQSRPEKVNKGGWDGGNRIKEAVIQASTYYVCETRQKKAPADAEAALSEA